MMHAGRERKPIPWELIDVHAARDGPYNELIPGVDSVGDDRAAGQTKLKRHGVGAQDSIDIMFDRSDPYTIISCEDSCRPLVRSVGQCWPGTEEPRHKKD